MTVTASLLSASPPTSNSIFLVGFLEGMKSLFPTTQPMGGKSLWAQKGESIRSVPLPCDPQKLLALRVTASATPVGVSHQRPPAPPPHSPGPILGQCVSLCASTSGPSGGPPAGSGGDRDQTALGTASSDWKAGLLGTSGRRKHIWKSVC